MDELIKILKSLHQELREDKPKLDATGCDAGYRNGFEDGYKFVTKRIKKHIDDLQSLGK